MSKGYQGSSLEGAKGGSVLGRTKDFMKEPDRFRDQQYKPAPKTDEVWSKGNEGPNPAPSPRDDKCLPTVKPRS